MADGQLDKNGVANDVLIIMQNSVFDDHGKNLTLFWVKDTEGILEGIAVETAHLESGVIDQQKIYDRLAQEYLNVTYGMIPKRSAVFILDPGKQS